MIRFLVIGCASLCVSLASAEPIASSTDVGFSSHSLQAVFVWALGKDPANVNDLEIDLQQELIKHGVASERESKLFPAGMTGSAAHLLKKMRATGCDSVLVTRRTSNIQWDAANKQTASLSSFIRHRKDVLNPKDALQGNFTAPIEVPNADYNADWEIVQGEALVFDMATGKPLWHGQTPIKSAKNLPQAKYLQFVAEKVVRELEAANLIGAIKR